MLANLAKHEPYSFKAVFDEVKLQSGLSDFLSRKPVIDQITAVSFPEAIQKGYMVYEKRSKDEVEYIKAAPKP